MRRSAIAVVLVILASCNRSFSTEKHELFRTDADGVGLVVRAELHGWHTPAHAGPDMQWISARDDFAMYQSTNASRGAKDLPVFDTSGSSVRTIDTPATREAGESELVTLTAELCALPHGVAFRAKDEWSALFVLGDRVFQTKLDSKAADCPSLGTFAPESVLSASPGGATACLALDEAGFRPAAIECLMHGRTADLAPLERLPKEGAAAATSRRVTHDHRDALVARLATDASAIDAMIERLATKPPPYEDILVARERLVAIDAAHALPRAIDRFTKECASSCSDDVVKYAELAIGWNGTANVTPDACAKGISFAQSRAAKGDADGLKRAFLVLRGFYACLDASARPLLVAGLGVATSADTKLGSPDARDYAGVDANCQPFGSSAGREVSGLCESFPRFAGTWLGAHCGPDAIAAATKIARDRPRTPFDPREDQVLDGALRVLGACDKKAFEAAIAHVPEKTLAVADIRSKEHLRAVFLAK